jgi:fatty-acyl-CoA synthase
MKTTMMSVPLSLNTVFDHAGRLHPTQQIVSRLPDKSYRRHTYAQWHARTRALVSVLKRLGLRKGDRVATLVLEPPRASRGYFGIPAAGGVMHTLNLRLAPAEIGCDRGPREGPLPDHRRHPAAAVRQFAPLHTFERVIVFPFSGAPVPPGSAIDDYEQLLATPPIPTASSMPSMPRTTRSRCATPRARRAAPRASCIRTARRCCTRWSAVSPTAGV